LQITEKYSCISPQRLLNSHLGHNLISRVSLPLLSLLGPGRERDAGNEVALGKEESGRYREGTIMGRYM